MRRIARQATPNSSSSSSTSLLEASIHISNPLAGRVVTTGRKVSLEFLEHERFNIGNLLKNLGWEKLCSLDVPTYPALVREFYSSMGRGDGGIVGTVRGIEIKINQSILSRTLEMPTEGLTAHVHSDKGGALSRMLEREVSDLEEVSANQFSLELRLLHNICGRILFSKTGRFDFVSERDIVLMDCTLNGYPLNLPSMMLGYMGEACTKKKVSLPYGMVLTLVFLEQGVHIPEEEPKKLLRHTDYYNESTLHRMGYKKVNGIWEKKSQEALQAPVREPETEANIDVPGPSSLPDSPPASASTSAPPPSAPAAVDTSSAFTEDLLGKIRVIVKSEQEETRKMINGLDERLRCLEDSYQISVMGFKAELDEMKKKMDDIADGSDAYSTFTTKL